MKKLISAFAVVIMVSILLSVFVPLSVQASGGVIDTSVSPFGEPYNRHSFYAQGLEWVFYAISSSWYYKTGNITGNVTSWSGATALPGVEWQDVYFDGTYCHSVGCTPDSWPYPNAILYRRSQPLGNGTLVLGTEELVQDSYSEYDGASVCVNASGYPFVAASYYTASHGVQLMNGSTNDGTYGSNSIALPSGPYPSSGFCAAEVVPMSGNEVLCVWGCTGGATGTIKANLWNGSSWGSTVSTSAMLYEPEAFSVVGMGSTATIMYLDFDIAGAPFYTITYGLTQAVFSMDSGAFVSQGSIPTPGDTINYDSYPVLSSELGGSLMYLLWPDPAHDSFLFRIKAGGVWGTTATGVTGADLATIGGHPSCFFADYATPGVDYGVYWFDTANDLKFSDELTPSGTGIGSALPATAITGTSAVMNGQCISDGLLATSATFYYQGTGMYSALPVGVGSVTSGDYFSGNITGLIPNTLYWYWVSFTNSSGTYLTNTVYFMTLGTATPEAPIVQTLAATFVSDTSATINGYLAYDGNLDCYLGFRWRQQGASTWNENMHGTSGAWPFTKYATYRSPQSYSNTLSGLAIDTTYEYQALAKNGVATAGVYGNTTTFTTLHAAGVTPTPGSGVIPPNIIPPSVKTFLDNLSGNVKLIIAILLTLGAMFLVGAKVKAKSSTILVVGTGFAFVILFSVFGWYPPYVIVIIGGGIALGILLTLGKGH